MISGMDNKMDKKTPVTSVTTKGSYTGLMTRLQTGFLSVLIFDTLHPCISKAVLMLTRKLRA